MNTRRLIAALAISLGAAAASLIPATQAFAATPLCTGAGNQYRGSSGDLSVPVVVSTNNPTCLIGNGLIGSHAAVSTLQWTFQRCYPGYLAPGFTVDGNWGPITRQTLINVQNHVGVSADGIYGPLTRNAMSFPSNDVPNRCYHY